MTPQEKAFELVAKMEKDFQYFASREIAIKHALVAVDMVIKCCEEYDEVHENHTTQVDYWKEVKQEIQKL